MYVDLLYPLLSTVAFLLSVTPWVRIPTQLKSTLRLLACLRLFDAFLLQQLLLSALFIVIYKVSRNRKELKQMLSLIYRVALLTRTSVVFLFIQPPKPVVLLWLLTRTRLVKGLSRFVTFSFALWFRIRVR